MTVYADVLITVNLFVNYALLLCTSIILRSPVSKKRILAGAFTGSLSCLIIFAPVLPFALDSLFKFAVSLLIVFISFGFKNIRRFIRCFLTFFAVNFGFCGIMYLLWTYVTPTGMFFNNGVAYFSIDLKILAISTVVCFTVLSLISHFTSRRAPVNSIYKVTVIYNEKSVTLTALSDTGNSLRESFSGYPVAVAEYSCIEKILPDCIKGYFSGEECDSSNFRLIPHQTVGGTGLLPSFRPDRVIIENLTEKAETSQIYIAVTREHIAQGEYEIIINPQIFEEENKIEKITEQNQKSASEIKIKKLCTLCQRPRNAPRTSDKGTGAGNH